MIDQFNKFVVALVGLLAIVGGVYCLISAILLSALPMQGIYYAVLGFGALWSGYYALRQAE